MTDLKYNPEISKRFRGFLPIVIDVETGGFNPKKDALLEIAAVSVAIDDEGILHPFETAHAHIEPFKGANLDSAALEFNKIDPFHPFRFAVEESEGLQRIFKMIRKAVSNSNCTRAIMVAHNPIFDLSFVNEAVKRNHIKRNPLHPFTSFDTATLGGLVYGQTVLAKIAQAAKIEFNADEAHSALYDTQKTAEIFCKIVNQWKIL
ncbi:MAG: ribonuclease T [Methylococcales bacterium]|jgi:ribonuclease T|nr:ribonuclease T [Methylococcales bacterium]